MTLLESINSPADLRALSPDQLRTVADDIRPYILETMSRVGGHTGASLGAVELAVALHYAFNTPPDRLVWGGGAPAHAPPLPGAARPAATESSRGSRYCAGWCGSER